MSRKSVQQPAPDDRLGNHFRQEAVSCLDGLYGFANTLCHDRATAEDLVQETYVRALSARRRPGPEENLRGWLFTILHNVWRNEVRRRRPSALEDLAELLVAPGDSPAEALHRDQERQQVRRAIAELPEAFRAVVLLRCVEGFSYRDVAAIVGCPAGTVMSRLARARSLLRKALRALGGSEAA
jgi:RNA polymerase sigma-70 factor (ECF subfamily)